MISEKDLLAELKRYPKFIKQAIKEKDYAQALEYQHQLDTLEFVLEA